MSVFIGLCKDGDGWPSVLLPSQLSAAAWPRDKPVEKTVETPWGQW